MGQILLSGEQSPSVCWIIFDVIRDFMDQIDIMGQPVSKCLPYNSWFVIINLMDTMFAYSLKDIISWTLAKQYV